MSFSTPLRMLLVLVLAAAVYCPLLAQTLDPAFEPTVAFTATQQPATMRALVEQADGRLLVAGDFAMFNNRAVANLVRLWPDGRVDTTFVAPAFAGGQILALAADAQGRVLAVGEFTSVGGQSRTGVARLSTTGALDATFNPNMRAPSSSLTPQVRAVLVQPDGNIVLGGYFVAAGAGGSAVPNVLRVLPSGQPDASFVPAVPYSGQVNALLLQPSGKLLVAGNMYGSFLELVRRLLPNGSLDPAFTTVPANQTVAGIGLSMANTANGFVLAGAFISVGNQTRASVARFLNDGTLDPTFTSPLPNVMPATPLNAVVALPTGKVIIGGATGAFALRGLLPNGSPDPDYLDPAQFSPPFSTVYALVAQPNGNLLVAGAFPRIAGQRRSGLARLLAPGALASHSAAAAEALVLYPNPAHDQLHVRLEAAARPQRLVLLDVLGRPVLTQPVLAQPMPPTAELSLATGPLRPGVYVLQVECATGTLSRWVVVQ
ncbi:T9SS type A sorting domain-containing protein [Hymenobacter convexus]|uniref:T9SS type A sorting domain-containing protein n=1 Tax=Hymenobacter sp. CA1UV-4 TaxID=3063782 RepID=UPI002712EF70|nr:T9SS type A sorting domain-containing protein [Hymenobacter sp. CA1UV-4]MDO7850906.1 T9SS type A sorting domain-containing protein [Hymenobacter sp. CA1UV-4]